jgi:phage I-like protein
MYAAASDPFALALNRAGDAVGYALPADGWYQIAKVSTHTKSLDLPGGKSVKIRQVISPADLETLAARYRAAPAELLIDFDHFSADQGKSTRAAAWLTAVEARGDGLWAQMRLSTAGRAALEGGDYRHFSPVLGFPVADYTPGAEVHPVALLGGALTNQPTFKGMLPLSNRTDPISPETTTMDYKTLIITLLGLQAAATDAEIQSAADKAKGTLADGAKLAATQSRLEQLEGEQIERDLDAKGLKGAERETWKVALTRNRTEALPLLATVNPAGDDKGGGYSRTHNRATAGTPKGDAADLVKKAELRAGKVSARAADLRAADKTLSLAQSYNRAEADIPAE